MKESSAASTAIISTRCRGERVTGTQLIIIETPQETTLTDAISGNSRYVALTTYRRDGRPVTTPVWAAPLAGRLYVVTAKSTGKARRVGVTSRVRFAPCNSNGRRILGEWQEGTARIVVDQARRDEALAALQRKYRWQMSLANLYFRLRGAYPDRVVLEVTPSPGPTVQRAGKEMRS